MNERSFYLFFVFWQVKKHKSTTKMGNI